jgi:hypothetical protein
VGEFIVPRLEKLDSQPEVQKLLKALLGHPGVQSFLWSGPEGSGKKTYALALVRSLFCQEGPDCVGCAICRQVLNKTHPDLFWVHRDYFWAEEADEKKKTEITIKVAQHLSDKLHRAPFSAPFKVAVVLDAEDMNEQAQNALLKTLEEPAAKTLIILLAEKTGDFLPTVLSRCRLIRFPALSTTLVETLLIQPYGWENKRAHQAALESNGNLTLAMKFGDEQWNQFREKVGVDFDRVLQGSDEDWLALGSEYDQWEPDFLGDKELTASQRKAEVLTAALQVYIALWSGRLWGNVEIPQKLATLPVDAVLKCLQKHQDMIPTHLNSKMILDHLFVELGTGFQKGELTNLSFMDLAVQI